MHRRLPWFHSLFHEVYRKDPAHFLKLVKSVDGRQCLISVQLLSAVSAPSPDAYISLRWFTAFLNVLMNPKESNNRPLVLFGLKSCIFSQFYRWHGSALILYWVTVNCSSHHKPKSIISQKCSVLSTYHTFLKCTVDRSWLYYTSENFLSALWIYVWLSSFW